MNVLIVDDHEDNLELISVLLEDQGYENLHTAANGKEAIEVLDERGDIDLVLLDINMPEMNGYEVLEHIKKHAEWRSIPVIMVTALDQLESVIRCVESGAEDYLTKPVEETLLRARVHASLERKYLRNKERELFLQVEEEKKKSESVLFNVLPESVAERLKKGEDNIAETIDDSTVLFADLVGFTELSTRISPSELVHVLNYIFRSFDQLAAQLSLEKIKTIGDSYMVVGGIPPNTEDHETRCVQFAMTALSYIDSFNEVNPIKLQLRIGVHTGPVVAGVIGQTRFTYDLWGETVNIASRMETLGFPGCIQISESTYERLGSTYKFQPRGKIEVKGKGTMETYIYAPPGVEANFAPASEDSTSSTVSEAI